MMFIYKTAKFASVWTIILKIRAIFVHQTLTKYGLYFHELLQCQRLLGELTLGSKPSLSAYVRKASIPWIRCPRLKVPPQ